MCQKYSPNLSQIQPSLPTSQSFKHCKYHIKHTYFFIIIHIYPKFIHKFNLRFLYLSHSNTVKSKNNPKFPKCVRNTSQIQPSLSTSQSFKYCKYQIKHTYFFIIIYIYPKFIPKLNLLSLYLSHSNTAKSKNNPKFPKCFRNTAQIQISLPTSQSFKHCKYQIKHTYFFIIIYIYPKFIPKFNLLSLYPSHSNTVKSKNNPKFPKCVRNTSQIQISLPTSQSFKHCKYQIKHTYFFIIIYIYPKFIPKLNLLSVYLSHSNTAKS